MQVPPSILRGRVQATTWLYGDSEYPDRVTGTLAEKLWLDSDRALMLALTLYEQSLCTGCGEPKAKAWHPDNDGWYETTEYVCNACTTRTGEPVVYTGVIDERDYTADPLPDAALTMTRPAPSPADPDG